MSVLTAPTASAARPLYQEGTLLVRYLARREPVPELLDRYAHACDQIFGSDLEPADEALVTYVRRHPRSLPFLDAAAGILNPHAVLRGKVLLMLALLETTPEYVDLFTARPCTRLRLLGRLAVFGGTSVVKILIGLVLYQFAKRA